MKKSFFFPLFLLILSGSIGFFFGKNMDTGYLTSEENSVRQSGYQFINPLLECENNGSFAKQKYIPFEKEVVEKIENANKKHPSTLVSVYFRNLNNGPWFGIGEDEKFLPASLMKVTILISYMHWWDEYPGLLEEKLRVTENIWLNQLIPPEKKIQINTEYSIRELLHYLIVYSDNNASRLLYENLPPKIHERTFLDLWVTLPDMNNSNYSVSVKEYASFFRILYNASYLSKKSSEEALSILSESAFKDGIVAGIHPAVPVAHKFGEREIETSTGTINQLHDCGIVYHPKYPYLLCIMTRWSDPIDKLALIIGENSRIISDEINKQYPPE